MAYATLDDLRDIDSTIQDYGILEWNQELAKSETDIQRLLRIRWWPQYNQQQRPRIGGVTINDEMVAARLTSSQWTRATVFHCLAYYILPQLTKFEPQEDTFSVKMTYYKSRFDEEFELCLRDGVEYDDNADNTVSNDERLPIDRLRMVR
jgi:hypothetical protein